ATTLAPSGRRASPSPALDSQRRHAWGWGAVGHWGAWCGAVGVRHLLDRHRGIRRRPTRDPASPGVPVGPGRPVGARAAPAGGRGRLVARPSRATWPTGPHRHARARQELNTRHPTSNPSRAEPQIAIQPHTDTPPTYSATRAAR